MNKKIIYILFLLITAGFAAQSQSLQKKDTSEVRFLNSRKFFIYKVEKGETLFSISQKFNIPQEEILQFNPDVQSKGLKNKMKLWIPAYSWLHKTDSTATVITEKEKGKHNPKNVYKVVVITALNLSHQYLDKKPDDSSYVEELIDKEVKANLEFVEGVKYMLEKMSRENMRFQLQLIDSENDTLKIGRALKRDQEYQAIITNENGATLKYISAISQNRNIKLFASGLNTNDVIHNNKYAVSLLPSSLLQCEMAGYFASKYFANSNAIIVKTSMTKENERSIAFKNGWMENSKLPVIQCDYGKNGVQGITDSLSTIKNTVIFISTSNEDMVTSILSGLKEKKEANRFSVIGLPTWQSFQTVDPKLLEACEVYIFNSGDLNYSSPDVISYRKYFRDTYASEPTESAIEGHDAALVLSKAILEDGKNVFDEKIPDVKGLYTNYHFEKTGNGSAFENQTIHVYKAGSEEDVDLAKKIQWR